MSMSRVPCSKSDFSMGIASPELDHSFNVSTGCAPNSAASHV
jgi:hypothetical protein